MSGIFTGVLGGGAGLGGTIAIGVNVDGDGTVIVPGITSTGLLVPFQALITSAEMLADRIGSIVLDIWKGPFASYPLSAANSIVAASPPTITSDIKSIDSVLSGWTVLINAGDVLQFHTNSVSAIQMCTLTLTCTKMS